VRGIIVRDGREFPIAEIIGGMIIIIGGVVEGILARTG
jgi:hypothetical protein